MMDARRTSMTIGERINSIRKKKGLSQEDLADRLDVTRQSVSLWETDQTIPTIDNLISIAKVFGRSLDELCRGVDGDPTAAPVPEEKAPEEVPPSTRKISRVMEKRLLHSGIALLCLGALALVTYVSVRPYLVKAEATEEKDTVLIEAENSIIRGTGKSGKSLTESTPQYSGHIASNGAFVANLGVVGDQVILVYNAKKDTTVGLTLRLANTTPNTTSCSLVDALSIKTCSLSAYNEKDSASIKELDLKGKMLASPCDGTYYDSWADLKFSGIPAKLGYNLIIFEALAVDGVPNIDYASVTGYGLEEHTHQFVTTVVKEATCTEGGNEAIRCSGCGLDEGDTQTPALGHLTDWGVCSRCGEAIYYYEAENAAVTGPNHIALDSKAHGGAGLDYLKSGSIITFKVSASEATVNTLLRFGLTSTKSYASGTNWYQDDFTLKESSGILSVALNGTTLHYADLTLVGSKSADWWGNTGFLDFTVNLAKGENTIVMTGGGDPFPNVDYLRFMNIVSATLTK
jgi:transcriptional regulator with XRE-family HTH domain